MQRTAVEREMRGEVAQARSGAAVARARRRLTAHVEAAVLHAAVELGILEELSRGAHTVADLTPAGGDAVAVAVLVEALAAMRIVGRRPAGAFAVVPSLRPCFDPDSPSFAGPAVAAASELWGALGGRDGAAVAAAVAAAELAARRRDGSATGGPGRVRATGWGHVPVAALMELASRGVLGRIAEGAWPVAEAATASGLGEVELGVLARACAGAGLLTVRSGMVGLREAAHVAFGRGAVRDHVRWLEQRMTMDRRWFWEPLGGLAAHVRGRPAPSPTSRPGSSSGFRRAFTRTSRPLFPLLLAVARAAASDLGAAQRPHRVLEIGSSLGHWGMAFARAHPGTTVDAVDAREVLAETRRHVAVAGLSDRYRWYEDGRHEPPAGGGPYDVVVLNEVAHTFDNRLLAGRLAAAGGLLGPGGRVLLADMVLEGSRSGPPRHLLSAVKLLVTGGGRLHTLAEHARLLEAAGLGTCRLYRLATTDLVVAAAGSLLPPIIAGKPAEPEP